MQAKKFIYFHRIPAFWINITGSAGIESWQQRRDWQLVFNSRDIPYRIIKVKNRDFFYVPAFLDHYARNELTAFARENIRRVVRPSYPVHPYAWLALLIFIPLIAWHGMVYGVWNAPDFLPSHQSWLELGQLDLVQLRVYREYYRLATALTLHVNSAHLAGNTFFGSIFLFLLARHAGPGLAVFITVSAGIAGNFLSIFLHDIPYISIGFSTAIFGCAGALGGFMLGVAGSKRNILLISGSLIGLLALLGTEGEHTDYAAHICGLICGLPLGWLASGYNSFSLKVQILWGLAALALPAVSWTLAFGLRGASSVIPF